MSVVTYRGISYDTTEYAQRKASAKRVQETYRGIVHEEVIRVEEVSK